MAAAILATKLYIPPPPPRAVQRPRLIERLDEGLRRKLTLISAPAGFGKTTLVSEWIAGRNQLCEPKVCVAWLSLDERDSEPVRFLTYIVAALQTIAPNIGEGVLAAIQSPQPPPIEPVLTDLLNEINALHGNPATGLGSSFILVLDDYHLTDARPVDDALTFIVEHLPAQMHLVITSREDPAIPIPRLRARGQLAELRAADMRFTASEATEFLNQVMGLSLSAEDIIALETRTEGWIAGLQLAALSMQSCQDVTGFIQAFAGDHRYIVDYLVEEVLLRQPEDIRNFLLQTAILDRLNGALCDAVTSQPGGKARLERLQRGNFFIIPLDDRRQWYRYHHLFADVLCMHLMAEQPDLVPTLHRRACEWFAKNGPAEDAIRHALAGGDFERAAGLIELAAPAMRKSRQEATLLGWMEALPEGLFRTRPVLSVECVGVFLSSGKLEGVEDRLRDAERWLETSTDGREQADAMLVMDEAEFRRLPGSVAMYHAGLAQFVGNVPDTVTFARQVLDLAAEDDYLLRGAAAALLGLASWTVGDLDAAYRSYADGMTSLQKAGNIADAVNGAITLATIGITQGHLRQAMSTYEQALHLATELGGPALAVRGAVDLYLGMSELYYERNDLQTATHLLQRSKELGEFNGLQQNRYRWRVAMARIRQAQGELDEAIDLLHEAERLYMSDFSPNVRPVAALVARVWIAQGKLGEAFGWAHEQGLSTEDDLSYLREFEHITLARLLLARTKNNASAGSICEAMGLLERLLKAAEEGGRMGRAIEILMLQALAHQMEDDLPAALTPLERALKLAEPEGYCRMFLDEGPDMEKILRQAALGGIVPAYTNKLLAAFAAEQKRTAVEKPLPTPPVSAPLIEPLSQRELEILRLFDTELSGPEIADKLVIALSTVRTHTKSIYAKLNVNNRRAAVKRATELGLI